jgi:hypothetical protein
MKNPKLKQLLKEKFASGDMQPHDDLMFLNQDELNQIGGTQCGVNTGNNCGSNFCTGYGGLGCGQNVCNGNA